MVMAVFCHLPSGMSGGSIGSQHLEISSSMSFDMPGQYMTVRARALDVSASTFVDKAQHLLSKFRKDQHLFTNDYDVFRYAEFISDVPQVLHFGQNTLPGLGPSFHHEVFFNFSQSWILFRRLSNLRQFTRTDWDIEHKTVNNSAQFIFKLRVTFTLYEYTG